MDTNGTPRPREVGPMVAVIWQLFTNNHEPIGQPVDAQVPNEITLAQLASSIIVPHVEGKFDANTVFHWCLEEKEMKYGIPYTLLPWCNLKVKANTVHLGPKDERLMELAFQNTHFYLGIRSDTTLETLSQAVAETIEKRGQGNQWYVEGNSREVVDFEFCYPIVPIPAVVEIEIFIKHKKYRVKVTESWMNVSDRLVAELWLPRGTLFRIFPVDLGIDRLDDEDHAYSFDWEEGKQYWFDIVHDLSRDRRGICRREIRMVDPFG
jgi:hypothetical protein